MCDYSLESSKRRDAMVGDQLKIAKIGMHGTIGLVSPEEPTTAVCLRPGTKVIISGIPSNFQDKWKVGAVATATFSKRDAHLSSHEAAFAYYRDGVIFDQDKTCHVLFQEFPLGLDFSIELMPMEERAPKQGRRNALIFGLRHLVTG